MAIAELVMPKLGESIMEATVLKWHKQVGDPVKQDETILDIATDKVDSEVPSTAEGTIQELLFNINDVVPIGTVIARISTTAAEGQLTPVRPPAPAVDNSQPVNAPNRSEHKNNFSNPPQENTTTAAQHYKPSGTGNRFYSPLVLNIAASE